MTGVPGVTPETEVGDRLDSLEVGRMAGVVVCALEARAQLHEVLRRLRDIRVGSAAEGMAAYVAADLQPLVRDIAAFAAAPTPAPPSPPPPLSPASPPVLEVGAGGVPGPP